MVRSRIFAASASRSSGSRVGDVPGLPTARGGVGRIYDVRRRRKVRLADGQQNRSGACHAGVHDLANSRAGISAIAGLTPAS